MRSAGQVFAEISSSKGKEFLDRSYYRSFTLHIFIANAEILFKSLEEPPDPLESWRSMSGDNEDTGRLVLREVTRHLHNFLSAASTLVDHTRVFVGEFYLGTDVNSEFKRRIDKEFMRNPLTRFVQDLRNFQLHCGLPPIMHQLSVSQGGHGTRQFEAKVNFYLNKERLVKWQNWKSASREFLTASEDHIILRDLVEKYKTIIYKFHDEFDNLLRDYHSAELVELASLQTELQKLEEGSK